MEEEVGGFVEEELGIIVFGFDEEFDGFFADFLGDFVEAFMEEASDVGLFGGEVAALGDGIFEGREDTVGGGIGLVPAGIGTEVAGGAWGAGEDEEGILVAVGMDTDEVEVVTALFAFGPEALFGAAEEGDALGKAGDIEGFLVHVA